MKIIALLSLLLFFPNLNLLAETRVRLTGSSTMAPLIQEIAERYEKSNSKARIDIQTGGSSRGIRDAKVGLSEIGMSSRALKKSENEGIKTHTFAQDGVAFIVHKKNPISQLSDEQLKKIFSGEVENWKEVGGADKEIISISRANGRSELNLLSSYLGLSTGKFKTKLVAGETQQALKSVIGNESAITFISLGAAEYEISNGAKIKLLPLKGIKASSKNVKSGKFPLTRPLVLITKSDLDSSTKKFLDFCLSEQVHDLINSYTFTPAS